MPSARRYFVGAAPVPQCDSIIFPCMATIAGSAVPGEFFFGCLLPRHYEAGMIGTVRVAAK